MIKAFGDIVKAIKEAEEAANKANKAADHAVVVSTTVHNIVSFTYYLKMLQNI